MIDKKGNMLTIVLFVIYALLLIGIILFKLPFYSPQISDGVRVINLIPFQDALGASGINISREIIDNILIFIPFGIYLCMLKGYWSLVEKTLSIIGLTLLFETVQFIFALGRSDITDIIDNTLGGIIGIAIYAILFKIFKSKTAKIVNILALIVTICVVLRFAQLFYLSNFVMRRLPPM